MAAELPNLSLPNDKVLANIKADWDANQQQPYRVILRRRVGTGMPETLATFGGVTLQQLVDFEIWLQELIQGGGGNFLLDVKRPDGGDQVGGNYLHHGGVRGAEPCNLNFDAMRRPDWTGPRKLLSPTLRSVQEQPMFPSTEVPAGVPSQTLTSPGLGGGFSPSGGWRNPPAPLSNAPYPGFGQQPAPDAFWARREADLQAQIQQTRYEAQIKQLESGFQSQLSKVVDKLDLVAKPPPPAPPKNDLKEVATVIVPMITDYLDRKERREAEERERREKRDAEDRDRRDRIDREAKAESQTREDRRERERREHEERIERARIESERIRRESDQKMLDLVMNQNQAGAATLKSVTDAYAGMVQTQLNKVAAEAELAGNQAAEGALTVIARAVAEPAGKALAASILARAPANAPVRTDAAAGALAGEITQQQPQQLPAAQNRPTTLVEQIIAAVRAKAPGPAVGKMVIQGIMSTDASLGAEAERFGGAVDKMLAHHLGDWVKVPENETYVAQVLKDIHAEGVRNKLWEPLPPEPPPPAKEQTVPTQTVPAQSAPAKTPPAEVVEFPKGAPESVDAQLPAP